MRLHRLEAKRRRASPGLLRIPDERAGRQLDRRRDREACPGGEGGGQRDRDRGRFGSPPDGRGPLHRMDLPPHR